MANTTRNHLRRMLRNPLTTYCQAYSFANAVAAVKAKAGKGKPQTKAVG